MTQGFDYTEQIVVVNLLFLSDSKAIKHCGRISSEKGGQAGRTNYK